MASCLQKLEVLWFCTTSWVSSHRRTGCGRGILSVMFILSQQLETSYICILVWSCESVPFCADGQLMNVSVWHHGTYSHLVLQALYTFTEREIYPCDIKHLDASPQLEDSVRSILTVSFLLIFYQSILLLQLRCFVAQSHTLYRAIQKNRLKGGLDGLHKSYQR